MDTNSIAIFIAIVSLIISATQWITGNSEKAYGRRTLLLQRILEAQSSNSMNLLALTELLRRYEARMDPEQITRLREALVKMRAHHQNFEQLYEQWSDYKDKKSVTDMEKESAHIDMMVIDAREMTQMIEQGRRSYE